MADKLMTLAEVADYLGLPRATIYQWRSRGEGPRGFRAGRHVRYRTSELERWIDAQCERDGTPAA